MVDLAAARTGQALPRSLWASVGSAGVPFQAAGGIRGSGQALDALAAWRQEHAVVAGTTAVWDPERLPGFLSAAGDRLVAAIDVRDGDAVGAGWTDGGRDLERRPRTGGRTQGSPA